MTEKEIYRFFQEKNAILSGHFQLTSGLHSNAYVQCARIFDDPKDGELMTKELAKNYGKTKIDWVVGPAMGGILLAYDLARHLGAKCAFTERIDGKMILRRGFSILSGSSVVVAEDVMTTGGSALEVAHYLESLGAQIHSIASLVNRSNVKLPYPTQSLITLKLQAVLPDACEQCQQQQPIDKPGSRVQIS